MGRSSSQGTKPAFQIVGCHAVCGHFRSADSDPRCFLQAFTFWANGFIPQDIAIKDLTKDFGDGLRLIALTEALTKAKLTAKYMKNPKTRVHFIENIHLALLHLSKQSTVKVASYGTEGTRVFVFFSWLPFFGLFLSFPLCRSQFCYCHGLLLIRENLKV